MWWQGPGYGPLARDPVGIALVAATGSVTGASARSAAPTADLEPGDGTVEATVTDAAASKRAPRVRVGTVVRNLDIPWDLTFLPSGAMLYTERDRERIWRRGPGGRRRVVATTPSDIWHSGETGLMSILAARSLARTRHFLTCHGVTGPDGHAIRVVRWRLNDPATRARRLEAVVSHLPTGRTATAVAGCGTEPAGRSTSAPGTPRSGPTRRTDDPVAPRSSGFDLAPAPVGRETRSPTPAIR